MGFVGRKANNKNFQKFENTKWYISIAYLQTFAFNNPINKLAV